MEFDFIMCLIFLWLTMLLCRSLPHPLLKYTAFFIIQSGIINSFYPELLNFHYIPEGVPNGLFAISTQSCRAALFALLVIFAVMKHDILKYIIWITILNAIYIIGEKGHGRLPWGIMTTSCMDGPLFAIILPLIWNRVHRAFSVIVLIGLWCTGSSVAIGGLCVALFIMFFRKNKYLLIIPPIIFTIAYFTQSKLLDDSLRFICWKWSYDWWMVNASKLFGTGLGTFFSTGPYIQQLVKMQLGNWYTFMHNDWLQSIFELGLVGFSLILSTALLCIRRAWNNSYLLASIVTYCAVSVFCMPTRYPLTAIIGVILIKLALEEDKKECLH